MEKGVSIKQWAEDDRPREKMAAHGAQALSKAELLAILIGSGVPGVSAVELMRTILADYSDSLMLLGRATTHDLMRYNGIGEAKAITILAACQLANLRLKEEMPDRIRINSAEDAAAYFRPRMQDLSVEECHLLLLDQAHQVKGCVLLSRGGLAGASVDVRELLRQALVAQSAAVMLCHNHPSGRLQPSPQDEDLTRRAAEACRTVGIRLLDHIIMGYGGAYYSFMENNRL